MSQNTRTDHELFLDVVDHVTAADGLAAALYEKPGTQFLAWPDKAGDLDKLQKTLQAAAAAAMQLNERARGVQPPKIG